MRISRTWLQKYFDASLPSVEKLGDALTFHAFEIESIENDVLDVKVLPNRAADCLSHRGIAKELSAILNIPLIFDPLRQPLTHHNEGNGRHILVEIEDFKKCSRYMGAVVKGVKVGSSPEWLKEALESVGQRSINNVVDATNYVMLNIGQPLHAFDARGLSSIKVRDAIRGEKMTTLSGGEYVFPTNTLLITDGDTGEAIGIAGIKGGKRAEISNSTTDIFVESANFDGTTIRKTAQVLKLFTDASQRFQNHPSPELVGHGMRDVLAIILEIAGGTVVGTADVYSMNLETKTVSVSLTKINGILGSTFTKEAVADVFKRLGLLVKVTGENFLVTPPFERTDLSIAEDLIEEVGRIIGYDKIPVTELTPVSVPADQSRFLGIERMKDQLVEQGFIEVSTQSFAKKGDITLANPLDVAKPALRTNLTENLKDVLSRAKHYIPRLLGPGAKLKLFEVGTVFPKAGEYLALEMSERVLTWGDAAGMHDNLSVAKLEEYGKEYTPILLKQGAYKPFSIYPFITRDIALWVPVGTTVAAVESVVRENAGGLLVRLDSFDQFEKEGRISYAFRLVFESMERTLTDEDANVIMTRISSVLTAKGYETR